MDDLNKAFNHLFGFKVPIDDYDEFEKKVEEAREIKEHLDKVEILKDIPQIITPTKMTNYDRIKSMSVEEMTALITKLAFFPCELCEREHNASCTHEDCFNIHKQWLLQEVK